MTETKKKSNKTVKTDSFFISAIGTDVGKTIISSIIAGALNADYWKPVQAGNLEKSDSRVVKYLTQNKAHIFPESYKLSQPISPHAAAKADNVQMELSQIEKPKTENTLIIEGAGGILVPINEENNMADIIEKMKAPVILVCRHYLGSINHTLLSIRELKHRSIPLAGVVFNEEANLESEEIIQKQGKVKILFRIPRINKMEPEELCKFYPVVQKALEPWV